MTDVSFETREIGSLAKPPWRVKAFSGRAIEEADVAEAERWAQKLDLEGTDELVEVLRHGEVGKDELRLIDDWSSRYGLALLERAGLDVVYDGEQRRTPGAGSSWTWPSGSCGRTRPLSSRPAATGFRSTSRR
jgi:5-methyltetrahydropteroyltriglutamate--homocysteine methyltransferase